MKALTFLEWLDKRQTRLAEELKPHRNNNELELYNTYALDVLHVSHFYNQPFTVDFLVNPVMADGVNIQPLIQQSESLRLFEGFYYNDDVLCYLNKECLIGVENWNVTVDKFIVLFEALTKQKLQFNKSNETIKKLFGEVKK